MFKKDKKKYILITVLLAAAAGTVLAVSSTGFNLVNFLLTANGGGKVSGSGKVSYTSVGQDIVGDCSSSMYSSKSGFIAKADQAAGTVSAADNLENTYVYPNPYKPGSGGNYDASFLTFTNLTVQAEIKIFNIAGELVATIDKNSNENDLQWTPVNDSGKTLASGVYIFYVSNDLGHKKTGKFAIVK